MRILLADDDSETLREVSALFTADLELVAIARDGAELIAAAQALRPDIVVTDVAMPVVNGIEASRELLAGKCCEAVVILSAHESPEIIRAAFEAGARAYVLKVNAGEDLVAAVQAVAQGNFFLSAVLRARTDFDPGSLTNSRDKIPRQ
ncbi:MAG TPA: response regulator transcription factor [Bryobacteraceae bacterium]|jgi:DNA-binding NarL/FixJ family response regulator|nr:response regulator transcription factor [Bryobacteraceae bacterium]